MKQKTRLIMTLGLYNAKNILYMKELWKLCSISTCPLQRAGSWYLQISFFIISFYWSFMSFIVALQCCVSLKISSKDFYLKSVHGCI